MQQHLLNTSCAPPLEAVSDKNSSASLAKAVPLDPNDTFIISSRSTSVSPSSLNSHSNSNSNSATGTHSNSSSVSMSAQNSFSNLSVTSTQNINIASNHSNHSNAMEMDMLDPNDHNTNNSNTNYSNPRRRSQRISQKRKRGHIPYYTPKSWAFSYEPVKKRRKTNLQKAQTEPIQNSNNSNSNTHSNARNTNSKKKATKKPSKQKLLTQQNNKMKVIHAKVKKARLQWIKYNYTSFEPFLSDRTRKRLKPKKNQNYKDIKLNSCKDYPTQPSSLCGGTLRDYQLYSLNWLRTLRNNGIPAILADEMGLGKTIQSIACIASFLCDTNFFNGDNKDSPSLIICPLSVAEAWLTEFNKWSPSLTCVLFHGPKVQRENIMRDKLVYGLFDICITTYEIATNNKGFVNKFYWNYFILDEAHRIKNENTNWHNALKCINNRSLYCVLLTGTPIQNNMHELWSLLSFIFSTDIFDTESATIFDSAYNNKINQQDKSLLSKTPYLLNPFFLRRLKSEVELSLPPKEEIIIKIRMSQQQKKYYKTFLFAHSSLIDQVSDVMYGGDKAKAKHQVSAWKKLRHLYTELRKIAMHPFLLSDFSHKICLDNVDEIISHSSKLQLLDKLLHRLSQEGHRVLLFSCFTLVLNLLEVYCEYRGYKYLRLDGNTSRIRRKIDIMRFNDNPNSQFFMYLISNRAGGLGINLQSADTVIHFDTDWNPQADLQAQARAHRIGQKNMVKIYRLITKDTVEERILFRSQQKLYLDAVVNKGAKMLQDSAAADLDSKTEEKFDLENEDLLAMIKFGAQKMFENENEVIDDEIDLDILLERESHTIKTNEKENENEQRKKLLHDLSLQNNVRDFNFGQELSAGNVFEGKTYEKKEFNLADEVDYSKTKRSGTKTMVKQLIVDGLKFTTRIQENPLLKFYKQCSEYIYDSKNTSPFYHELNMCWGCDKQYTKSELKYIEDEIIKCQSCPKTFHNNKKCFQGEHTKMGTWLCSQHNCYTCNMKTSECGMILRCIGCQMSFCYEHSPKPYWSDKTGENEGLYFMDECRVAQHFNFYLPQAAYMYILCSKQCKKFYDQVYSKRQLPDLSLKYDNLDHELKKLISKSCKDKWADKRNKKEALSNIWIDYRIDSETNGMASKIIQRLKQNIDADCQLLERFYDILYLFPISDFDDNDSNSLQQKQNKDYILGKHYTQINELNDFANNNLCLPQWKQCLKCKQWRVIAIKINELYNEKWLQNKYYQNWICSEKDGFENLCNTKQEVPNKTNHNEWEINLLRLQRQAMSVQYKIRVNKNKNISGIEIENQKRDLLNIGNKMNKILNEYKLKSMSSLSIINEKHICEARYIGIAQWNGFIHDNYQQNNVDKICQFYEHLITQFRHWRIESLKTLMDHLGFFVVSRKKQRNSKDFRVDTIALSYNKQKVIHALSVFLIYPINDSLVLTTAYFSK